MLILLTDGVNDAGELDPRKAIDLAVAEHVKIYTIGIGADSMRVDGFFGSQVVNPSADLDEKMLTDDGRQDRRPFLPRAQHGRTRADLWRDRPPRTQRRRRSSSSVRSTRCSTGRCRWRLLLALLAALPALPTIARADAGAARAQESRDELAFGNFHFLRPWWLLALLALPLLWRALRQRRCGCARPGAARSMRICSNICSCAAKAERGACAALARRRRLAARPASRWPGRPGSACRNRCIQNRAARVIALELAPTHARAGRQAEPRRARALQDRRHPATQRRRADRVDRLCRRCLRRRAADRRLQHGRESGRCARAEHHAGRRQRHRPRDRSRRQARCSRPACTMARSSSSPMRPATMPPRRPRARARPACACRCSASAATQGAPIATASGGFLKDSAGNIAMPRLDAAALAAVATAGGGRYADYSSDAQRSGRRARRPASARRPMHATAVDAQTARFLDRGPWLLLLLVPLAALGFRRGWLMLLPLRAAACSRSAPRR